MIFVFQLPTVLSQVTSFESLCDLNPDALFMLPPNSQWNYRLWMYQLCQLDGGRIIFELEMMPSARKLQMIVSNTNFSFRNIFW